MSKSDDMMIEASHGNWDSVFGYLQYGLNINYQDDDGNSLLLYAAMQGRWDIAEQLLNKGHDPNLKRYDNATPLVYAKTAESVKLLARYNASPYIKVKGHLPVMYIMGNDYEEAFQAYLDVWGHPYNSPSKKIAKTLLKRWQFDMFELYTGQTVTADEIAKVKDDDTRTYNPGRWNRSLEAVLKRCEFRSPVNSIH